MTGRSNDLRSAVGRWGRLNGEGSGKVEGRFLPRNKCSVVINFEFGFFLCIIIMYLQPKKKNTETVFLSFVAHIFTCFRHIMWNPNDTEAPLDFMAAALYGEDSEE